MEARHYTDPVAEYRNSIGSLRIEFGPCVVRFTACPFVSPQTWPSTVPVPIADSVPDA